MFRFNATASVLLGFAVLLGTISGCGESTGSVKGKVYLQEKVVTAGTVAFVASNNKVATAQIQADGSYHIISTSPGLTKIGVTAPVVVSAPPGMKQDGKNMGIPDAPKSAEQAKGKIVPIPAKYNDPEKSGVTHTVAAGAQEFDIKLP